MSYWCPYWRFIVSKNRLKCKSTKIPHSYWRQANSFVSITIRTDLPDILLPMRLRNDLSFSKIAIFHFVKKNRKFPHSRILQKVFSSWIEKTMTKTIRCHWENRFVPYGNVLFLSLFSLSKNWMYHVGWGCAEILPEMKLFTFRCVNTEASADCNDYSKTSLNSFFSFWSSSKVIEVSKKFQRKHHLRGKHQIVYIPPRNHLREGWLQWTNCEAY